ncbi:hypothetical protein SUDANB121_03248 [Nocardiopsis dassonvillei]|uniref:hypothetical protein n=1 Tax=Nocardiopsis dassonvillei TaxID=2014 RepID=UPI003F5580E8
MPTTFHRARRLLAAGAVAATAVLGLAACENTTGGGETVDSEEMTEEPLEEDMGGSEEMTDDMTEESMDGEVSGDDMEGDMSEEGMEDDMSDDM